MKKTEERKQKSLSMKLSHYILVSLSWTFTAKQGHSNLKSPSSLVETGFQQDAAESGASQFEDSKKRGLAHTDRFIAFCLHN